MDYSKKTNQELLTEFNKIADKHSELKNEVLTKLDELEKLEKEYQEIAKILLERKG